jgi:hypothetical protein
MLQARSRLREIHAGLLQQQLAKEMADVDVAKQMGWDRDGQDSDHDEQQVRGCTWEISLRWCAMHKFVS